jgi:hypothetical protein
MFGMVVDYLNNNQDILNNFPGFKDKYAEFLKKTEEITAASKEQSEYTKKESIEKKKFRKNLEEKMLETSRKLKAYATLNQNFTLLANCRYTQWSLTRLTQIDLISCGGNLHIHAEEHIRALGPYGITIDTLKSLREATDAYLEIMAEPRSNEGMSSSATKSMARAFSEADEALRFIDIAAKIAGESDNGFYTGYRVMRKQIKAGSVKMALKAQATDKVSKKPVSHARFTFILKEPSKKWSRKNFTIVKKTKKFGGFNIMHMPAGEYEVVANKPGYIETRIKLIVEDSVLVRLRVEMKR